MINKFKKILTNSSRSIHGVCSMCDDEFLDSKLTIIDELSFCPKDFEVFKAHKWRELENNQSDPSHPDNALKTQKHHDRLKAHNIPSYIQVSYSERSGTIYSNFSLYVPNHNYDQALKVISI